jgi:hypothetical protein
MTQEEKARAYDEALALMVDCVPDEDGLVHVRPHEIFQELAESEDERIRKELSKDIWNYIPYEKAQKYITWLKKQDKPKDKSVLEVWKDMRLEVYQQASGNRHEANYSDDNEEAVGDNEAVVALDADKESAIGKMIWSDIENVMNLAIANKVKMEINFLVEDSK